MTKVLNEVTLEVPPIWSPRRRQAKGTARIPV